MAAINYVTSIDDPAAIKWLRSPLTLLVIGDEPQGQGGDAAKRLAAHLEQRLPTIHVEVSGHRIGVDLGLVDAADQAERTSAFLRLRDEIATAGFAPRLLETIDDIRKPTIDAQTSLYLVLDDLTAYIARDDAMRAAAAPLLVPFLADPKAHGIASVKGFRIFHAELGLIERYIVRGVIESTTKTRGGRGSVTGRKSPFTESQLIVAAEALEVAGWLEAFGKSRYNGSYDAARGVLARGLSAKELLRA